MSIWVFFSFFKILLYFTLQYCIGFAIHQHESSMGAHVIPILNPPPPSLPIVYHLDSIWTLNKKCLRVLPPTLLLKCDTNSFTVCVLCL